MPTSNKEAVLEAIREMPEEASFEELIERIQVLVAIHRGEADADAGRFVSHEEVKERIRSWILK